MANLTHDIVFTVDKYVYAQYTHLNSIVFTLLFLQYMPLYVVRYSIRKKNVHFFKLVTELCQFLGGS
jgi:hypothetical protein